MKNKAKIKLLSNDNNFLMAQAQEKSATIQKQRDINSMLCDQRDEMQQRIIQLEISNTEMAKENQSLKIELDVCSVALESAESALNHKEIAENNNAEFMAKIITAINNNFL